MTRDDPGHGKTDSQTGQPSPKPEEDTLTEAIATDTETPGSDIDPDKEARRGKPLVTETDAGTRIWATGWYRTKPRTFVHHELFFDPEQMYCVYAEESYKSYLLRRSGREQEAARIGRRHLGRGSSELLDHSRSFAITVGEIEQIRIKSGSVLFKPKLAIETTDYTYEFYHWRRGQDVGKLAVLLRDAYSVDVIEK